MTQDVLHTHTPARATLRLQTQLQQMTRGINHDSVHMKKSSIGTSDLCYFWVQPTAYTPGLGFRVCWSRA